MAENPINLAETAAEAGVLIYRLGFMPLQVVGKNPEYGKNHGKQWQKTSFNSEREVVEYFSDWAGTMIVPDEIDPKLKVVRHKNIGAITTGYVMFGPNTQEAYDALRAECPFYDETLQRIGNNPYPSAIFKRADDEPFWSGQKITTNDDDNITMADIWGDRNQFVAWGVHPKGARYRFTNNNPILPMSTALAKDITLRALARMGSGYRLKTQDKKEQPIEEAKPREDDHNNIFKLVKSKVRMRDVLGTSDTRIMCPLHKQGTSNPAAVIYENPDGDVIYCHSCGGLADVIAIRAKKNGLTQYAAALELAKEYGIEVSPSPMPEAQEERERVIALAWTTNGFVTSEMVYQSNQVLLRSHKIDRKTQEETISERRLVECGLNVINQVVFAEPESTIPMWHIVFGGSETTGDIDAIAEKLAKHAVLRCNNPSETKKMLTCLLHNTNAPVKRIYPAVGIYWNLIENRLVDATSTENFMAQNETQQQLFGLFTKEYTEPSSEEKKRVHQATVDFIQSMPKLNRFAAYVTRCYGCVAPLSYELKRSNLGVFPYLYLFGAKGSSKTHIAMCATSYCWGEVEPLTGQSVESPFRLGTEFSATKFPRVIDEAHDVFRKNQEIFKAGATSILATKRGNKDKTMISYPAFCTFVLTSNLPPIYEEEDAQGGVADRLLVVDCFRDEDFDNKKYQEAFTLLNSPASRMFGRAILAYLEKEINEKKMSGICREIFEIAANIQLSAPKITPRRAYCIAELVYGSRIYTGLLRQEGIEPLYEEDKLRWEIIDKLGMTNDDKAYIQSFMQYATMVRGMDEKMQAGTGIYFTRNKKGEDEMIIIRMAITQANQKMGSKNPTVRTLADLEREFNRFGLRNVRAATQRIGEMTCRGICINLKEYEDMMDQQEPKQEKL